jgi:DNA-directed RNA polymerase subunit beta
MAQLGRKLYARTPNLFKLPSLIEIQLDSFQWFQKEGLLDLFDEVNPIESFNHGMKLFFPGHGPESQQFGLRYWFEEPKHNQDECLDRDLTFSAPLYCKVLLLGDDVSEPIVSDLFLGDFPLMTEKGTFIINGTERVVVSQLIRSPGVYFEAEQDRVTGRVHASAKLIPDRGAWMEFETRKNDHLAIKFNRKRTVPVTILLRALASVSDGLPDGILTTGSDEEILALFQDVDTNPDRQYISASMRQEPAWDVDKRSIAEEAIIEFFKRMRPGDPATLDNAKEFLEQQLFDQRRYDLERVGRYKLNQKLNVSDDVPLTHRMVTKYDLIALIKRMIRINNGEEFADDIDHLGNRRVKTVGELIQNKLRVGLRRMERVVRERMSIRDQESSSPVSLVNIRPLTAAIREFFGSSQLSQFMDQTNPLAELRHKRTLSALGPGGLRRERAGFDVRDVHHSHYGRICPIETPEGPNIGLIGRLACFAKVNEFGFIETPYRRVLKEVPSSEVNKLIWRTLDEDVYNSAGALVGAAGTPITAELAAQLNSARAGKPVAVIPFVSDDVFYLSADVEDRYVVAQANAALKWNNEFVRPRVSSRSHSKFIFAAPKDIHYMDIAPRQVVGISAALIPFLEHDDANRALMGSNMQAQAVPLLQPDVPIVSTGMEEAAAHDSGQVIVADAPGEVISVTSKDIKVLEQPDKVHIYRLRKFQRSNQSTCIDQRPVVVKGQRIQKGQVIADSSSTNGGELALGQDVIVAYLSWEGGNYEDAILVSERLVREDRFTSIHIEKHEIEARDTKLGPEEITYDIPNVGEDALKDLDEAGIIRVGAYVAPNDILVGKITPKGEKELSPEEKLLRAIFGEKAREVKDSSLRMPHGEHGKVVDVRVLTREEHSDLPAGVDKMVRVAVAQRRKLTEGDKMAGRHGNKGVISKVVPIADMPYLDDGTPIDIILNPLGVPGRMNIGQILETHLGWAASRLGFRALTPVFDGANELEIEAEMARSWLIDYVWREVHNRTWAWLAAQEYSTEFLQDDIEAITLYLEAWLGQKYDIDRLMTDLNYARRSALCEWLREQACDPDDILVFEDSELDAETKALADDLSITTCLKFWAIAHGATVPDGATRDDIREIANRIMRETEHPMPILGKMRLRDGRSGEHYDQPVTVGVTHMLKLAHLVEDKAHARSTGPYSLVTQQPLGGKAQFGGQRFGEMEVWALEAYGAAHTLQEMLTIKSDDVQGRVKTYESIVKGEEIEEPGIPASFRVLVKELQSLGLAVEAVTDTGEVIKFGKEDEKQRAPRLGGMGLLDLHR